MGKQGPCHHCGVTSTPLWRNGPPEKPILCNACGSRWRTKGTLTNYTPLHARADIIDSVDDKVYKVKGIAFKAKEQKFHKRKHLDMVEIEGEAPYSEQNFRRVLEEDISNRSSSGSVVSYSESSAQFGSTDAIDFTGSSQSNVWDSLVPSKKRTCVSRPKPSVEKLTKDLYCILHEQQSCNLSGSSDEELIFESDTPLVSVEIGHGGVLIRHPHLVVPEEDSEASSLPIDNNKVCSMNNAYSGLTSHPVHSESKGSNQLNIGSENFRKLTGQGSKEHAKRGKFSQEKVHVLYSDSPLGSVDLRDIVSYEGFMRLLTQEERQHLLKYLPYPDTAKPPESLKNMFDSPQFVEALYSFQMLLLEGLFDPSSPASDMEVRRLLKRLALGNLTKSKWVEQYQLLEDVKNIKGKDGKGVPPGNIFHRGGHLTAAKRTYDGQNQNLSEANNMQRISGPQKCGNSSLQSTRSLPNPSDMDVKESYDAKDMDNDGSCFSLRSLFAFTPERSSIMLDSLQFTDESSDQDLLFDVPPNAPAPQAELFHIHPCKQRTPVDCLSADSEAARRDKTLSHFLSSSV